MIVDGREKSVEKASQRIENVDLVPLEQKGSEIRVQVVKPGSHVRRHARVHGLRERNEQRLENIGRDESFLFKTVFERNTSKNWGTLVGIEDFFLLGLSWKWGRLVGGYGFGLCCHGNELELNLSLWAHLCPTGYGKLSLIGRGRKTQAVQG